MTELRNRLTLSELVSRKVRLTRAGREFKGCCPFHREKTPSFYVNDDKQFYHCFGCGAHGDAIGFVMQEGNLSFVEAVESLAAQAGLQVPKSSPEERESQRREKDLYTLLDEAALFYETRLQDGRNRDALAYLQGRGLSDETIAAWRLGFATADGQGLRAHLRGKGYTDQQMMDAGVVRASGKEGREPYDFFRDRVMFPVSDSRGRIVAFGGRILPEHLRPQERSGFTPPKYINSADTALFHKGRMLYGAAQARQAAGQGEKLIVVEGYLDVIACAQAGFRGAVAPLGTAMTEEQILLLWRMLPGPEKKPVLCFDGDPAGQRAAVRACERIMPHLKPDHSAAIVFMPQGEDPDSLIRARGRAALDKVLDGAAELVDFLWMHNLQLAGRNLETPESQAGLSSKLEDEALRIADRNVQHYYREAFKSRLRDAFSSYRGKQPGQYQTWKKGQSAGSGIHVRYAVRPPRPTHIIKATRVLLACILNHPAVFGTVEETLGNLEISDPELNALREKIVDTLAETPEGLDREALQSHLNIGGFAEIQGRILNESVYIHAAFARPEAEPHAVLMGCKEIFEALARPDAVKQGKADIKASIFDNDEARMLSIHMDRVRLVGGSWDEN